LKEEEVEKMKDLNRLTRRLRVLLEQLEAEAPSPSYELVLKSLNDASQNFKRASWQWEMPAGKGIKKFVEFTTEGFFDGLSALVGYLQLLEDEVGYSPEELREYYTAIEKIGRDIDNFALKLKKLITYT
jgi:hypothetical protein